MSTKGDWVQKLYSLAWQGHHDASIDLVYDKVEALLVSDMSSVDVLLSSIKHNKITANEAVALLIVTLGAKSKLPSRKHFLLESIRIWGAETFVGLE